MNEKTPEANSASDQTASVPAAPIPSTAAPASSARLRVKLNQVTFSALDFHMCEGEWRLHWVYACAPLTKRVPAPQVLALRQGPEDALHYKAVRDLLGVGCGGVELPHDVGVRGDRGILVLIEGDRDR